ncbi:hypothetical protein BDB01DRAFT_813137 [Pilobolus umbonatus]|nr:hypothetical protein BDB01DRAFT_813137 [Pilobolus umbonatus]
MKLSLLISTLSAFVYVTAAAELYKREYGLPFETLPSTQCVVPTSCSSIGTNLNCHCNSELINCRTADNTKFCWGSPSLNMDICPAMPDSCASTLAAGAVKCLCNAKSVLCVDNRNNYCYGTISGSTVTLASIPVSPPAANATTPSTNQNTPGMSTAAVPSGSTNTVPVYNASGDSQSIQTNLIMTTMLIMGAFYLIQ